MKTDKAKIIIVDDHVLFRDGLKTIIELSNIGAVIGEATNGVELLGLLDTCTPDLIIIDIDMPLMDGIEATKKTIEKFPDLNILVVTMFSNQNYYTDMVSAGAKGFILKTASKAELSDAINKVLKGGNYFSKELIDDILKNINNITPRNNNKKESVFNTKDINILNLMLKGLSAKEISEQLALTPKTVSNYKTLMLEKTGCKNSIELIAYALKTNAIELK